MFRYCVLVAACGLLLPVETVAVLEVVRDVRFRTYGDKVHIHYTMEGKGKYEVSLLLSDDGGRTVSIVPKTMSGAVGKGVKPGPDKQIIWDVLRDYPRLEGSDFVFRVIVTRFGGWKGAAYGAYIGAMLGGAMEIAVAVRASDNDPDALRLRRIFRGRYGIVTGIFAAACAWVGGTVRVHEMQGQSPRGSIHLSRRQFPPRRQPPTEQTPPGSPAHLVVEEQRRARCRC